MVPATPKSNIATIIISSSCRRMSIIMIIIVAITSIPTHQRGCPSVVIIITIIIVVVITIACKIHTPSLRPSTSSSLSLKTLVLPLPIITIIIIVATTFASRKMLVCLYCFRPAENQTDCMRRGRKKNSSMQEKARSPPSISRRPQTNRSGKCGAGPAKHSLGAHE